MQEADEQDTCRICSAPAEPDQPLFHPCKCSGTIRYIHQDCLTTWLAHSKKKHCDVCKHPYSFTKVYAPNMPSRLPPLLLLRRLLQSAFFGCLYGIRAIAVAIIWLAVLPLVTVWTWRMYFSMGDSTAWWISDRERPAHGAVNPFYYTVPPSESTPPPSPRFLPHIRSHPLWNTITADIFSGQIIASLIVLTFVAIFLLREWISQNARPGFFDEDLLPEERPQQANDPPAEPVPPPNPPANPAPQFLDLQRADHEIPPPQTPRRTVSLPEQRRGQAAAYRVRKRSRNSDLEELASPGEAPENKGERRRKESFARRLHSARREGARRRWEKSPEEGPFQDPPTLHPTAPLENYPFTFRTTVPDRQKALSPDSNPSTPWLPPSTSSSSTSSPVFPTVNLEPPRAAIPFQLLPGSSLTNSQPSPGVEQIRPRRPPLPGATLTGLPPSSPLVISPARTPLESPSLATYRAPEELDAGPSNLSRGYFDNALDNPEVIRGEDEETPQDYPTEDGYQEPIGLYPLEVEEEAVSDLDIQHPLGGEQGEMNYYFREGSPDGADPQFQIAELASDEDTTFSDGEMDFNDGLGIQHEGHDGENGGPVPPVQEEPVIIPGEVLLQAPQGAVENLAAAQAAVGEAAADLAAIAEAQEDLDANAEDDMEGAMEAIGMRGPIYGVVQNATLMIFVLDTAMGLGIWIPYTIGKSTALLTLDPPRLLKILHFPIRVIRVLTDPIVDTIVYTLSEFLFPPIIRLSHYFLRLVAVVGLFLVRSLFGSQNAQETVEMSHLVFEKVANITERTFHFSGWSSPPIPAGNETKAPSQLEGLMEPLIVKAEPYFALLGAEVRAASNAFRSSWTDLALGHGSTERVFALTLGYVVAGVLLALYLNVLTVGSMKSAGRAVRTVVRQQLLVLKVAMFIFIELVTFPLGCGLVLDFCTVWLFPEASVATRLAFFWQAPLTAMFYHWIAGTMFMYSFAILLSGCRTLLRPGAMWFIRDPQDQNAHPIRDILDRPTVSQFRKICISGCMYTVVVVLGVGTLAALLFIANRSIFPIRWKNREPLSHVPFDLLFLHLVLPYSMHYFRPKEAIKKFSTMLWRFLAHKLRLTSYYYGERRTDEEYTPQFWRTILTWRDTDMEPDAQIDGSFRRVPATDNIALPREMRATAAVSEAGVPVDAAAKRLIELQDAETIKAKRSVKDDYMVVYIPPRFAQRVLLFIGILWILGSILLAVGVALPIQLGRSFFAVFIREPVHDGYSLIVGFYLLWGCYIVGVAMDKLDKRRQRRPFAGMGVRADLRLLAVKRGLLWTFKAAYMGFALGIVLPCLLAIVMDLYLVMPVRMLMDPRYVPRIRIVDSWALGLLYAKIGIQIRRFQAGANQGEGGLNRIMANGWTRLQPWIATKELILPVGGGLMGMIVLPAALFRALVSTLALLNIESHAPFNFLHIYPSIFVFTAACRGSYTALEMLGTWSQSVRDKEFLVEMRLRNHDPNDQTEELSDEDSEHVGAPIAP